MFYDSTYLIFMVPAFILMAVTSWYVKSSYKKWSKVRASSGLTGAQAAQRLISTGNLYDVKIQAVAGNLTDHYDPRDKTLSLSQGVINSPLWKDKG
jgi:Zn-dependent membrane protease YugP